MPLSLWAGKKKPFHPWRSGKRTVGQETRLTRRLSPQSSRQIDQRAPADHAAGVKFLKRPLLLNNPASWIPAHLATGHLGSSTSRKLVDGGESTTVKRSKGRLSCGWRPKWTGSVGSSDSLLAVRTALQLYYTFVVAVQLVSTCSRKFAFSSHFIRSVFLCFLSLFTLL